MSGPYGGAGLAARLVATPSVAITDLTGVLGPDWVLSIYDPTFVGNWQAGPYYEKPIPGSNFPYGFAVESDRTPNN